MNRGVLRGLGIGGGIIVLVCAIGIAVKHYRHRCELDGITRRAAASVYRTIWTEGRPIAMVTSALAEDLRGTPIDSVVCEPSTPAFLGLVMTHRDCIVVKLITAPIVREDGGVQTLFLGYRVEVFDANGNMGSPRQWTVFESGDGWNKASTGK